MDKLRPAGRVIGLLLVVHLAIGLILPYVLLLPVSTPAGAFLKQAAGMATTVRLSVLMLLIGSAASLGIATVGWPIFRQRQPRLALWLLALAAITIALQLIENAHWLTLLSISQAYAASGAGEALQFEVLGLAAHAAFRWAHYSHILVAVGWLLALYSLLYRGAYVPRALALAGAIGAMLHVVGIILPAFGGYRMPYQDLFGVPLAFATVATGSWLMAKGLRAAPAAAGGPVRDE